MKIFLTTIVTLTLIALVQAGQTPGRASPEEILKRQVSVTDLNDVTVTSAVREAFSTASVPGGIVSIPECREEMRYRFVLAGSSLNDVLDTVVSTDSRYKWQIDQGVVNLIPRKGIPELLNLHITKFYVREARILDYALDQLLRLPEVQKRMAELNLSEGVRRLKGSGYLREDGDDKDDPKLTVKCKDVTLREALNAIVRAHGRAVWSYRERNCNGQDEFSIEFLVL